MSCSVLVEELEGWRLYHETYQLQHRCREDLTRAYEKKDWIDCKPFRCRCGETFTLQVPFWEMDLES